MSRSFATIPVYGKRYCSHCGRELPKHQLVLGDFYGFKAHLYCSYECHTSSIMRRALYQKGLLPSQLADTITGILQCAMGNGGYQQQPKFMDHPLSIRRFSIKGSDEEC